MNGPSRSAPARTGLRWAIALAFVLLPMISGCGPGGSVYVGVAAPGPWVGYPGGYYPGAWGYPGYRWEEEEDGEDPLDEEAPSAQSPESESTLPLEDAS